jgi:hypothetical protein
MPKNRGFVTPKSAGNPVPVSARGRRGRPNGFSRGRRRKLFIESRAKQVSYWP